MIRKNEKGFTLIEMLVVLFIIAILIMVTIPNVAKHFSSVDERGCDAYTAMVQGQVQAYKLSFKKYPTFAELEEAGYLGENSQECPGGSELEITSDGTVAEIVVSSE